MSEVLYQEALAAAESAGIDAATTAELCAWVSGALGLWREPGVATDPAADDVGFVEWLAGHRSPVADRLLTALGAIAAAPAAAHAAAVVAPAAAPDPGDGWVLSSRRGLVVAMVFVHADGAEVLLVDVDDGAVADLHFVADADVEALLTGADDATLRRVPAEEAAAMVAEAWARVDVDREPADSHLANQALVRARLGQLGHPVVEPAWTPPVPLPATDPEADDAAAAALRSALGSLLAEPEPDGAADLVEPAARLVRWIDADGRPVSELEALASLEWADWLGAVIGLCRAGVGAPAGGRELVDHVNRVPEVTSTIPARDRRWFEWAFAVAVETWADVGIVDGGGRLTAAGRWALPQALLRVWDG